MEIEIHHDKSNEYHTLSIYSILFCYDNNSRVVADI